MSVSGVDTDFDVLAACEYVLAQRRMYNQTNGAKGAFVVAMNNSFGFENVFPTSTNTMGLWCALFDTLGMEGIINIGATSNAEKNVDISGDMPTTCGSEFLISVTNINTFGVKVSSGYGEASIDMGAPGTGSYSTLNVGNSTPGYGTQIGGTSAATPHVTGTVALLYSLGCLGFTEDAISNPAACARRVREVILNNTEYNATLKDITTTDGQLNVKKVIDGVTKICEGKVGPLTILDVQTTDVNQVKLYYQTPLFLPYAFRVFNMLGQTVFEKEITPDQFSQNFVEFNFNDLPSGVYVLTISRGIAMVSVKFPKI
jgi:hypothetical protein